MTEEKQSTPDANELREQLQSMRSRFEEFRGRL